MNDEPHKDRSDELLDRAIGAMNEQANRSELPQRTITDTLAALRKAGAKQSPGIWKRVIEMTTTHKIAAAVGLTVGALVLYFVLSLFSGFSSVSYADVAARIRSAKSVSFDVTAQPANSAGQIVMHYKWISPGRTRIEMPDGSIMIIDQSTQTFLLLQPQTKTAYRSTFVTKSINHAPASQPAGHHDLGAFFKSLANAKGEPVGEESVGGIKANRFRAKASGLDADIFADARTGVLLKVALKNISQMSSWTCSNFNFDAHFDPSLFSMEPPVGYTLKK